jgi:hypothetical protein
MQLVCVLNNMHKIIFFQLFFCFAIINASAQDISVVVKYTTDPALNDKSLIFYDNKTKLTWDDFKAIPDDNMIAAALTDAGFGYGSSYSSNDSKSELTITVYCDFDKKGSWVKSIGRNDYILKHEQHHFDISYICTLLFIKNLRETKFTSSNYDKLIREAYQQTAATMTSMQNQYDAETHNGILKDKQEEWANKIDKQLQSLQVIIQ